MDRSLRRRVAIVAIAAFVAVTCVALGFWQLRRLDERRTSNAAIERGRTGPPRVLTSGRSEAEPLPPYTPVRASGSFDPDHEVLVYGRSLDGRSGHWLVTPLVFVDGSAALVVRGWIPFEYQRAPVPDAAPPEVKVTIDGLLLPDEGGSTRPDEHHVVGRLDVGGIGSSLPYPVYPLPIQLTEEPEPRPGDLPVPIGWPELSEGPHLSYAIQWFSFAAIAVVGAVVLVRRERRGATRPVT